LGHDALYVKVTSRIQDVDLPEVAEGGDEPRSVADRDDDGWRSQIRAPGAAHLAGRDLREVRAEFIQGAVGQGQDIRLTQLVRCARKRVEPKQQSRRELRSGSSQRTRLGLLLRQRRQGVEQRFEYQRRTFDRHLHREHERARAVRHLLQCRADFQRELSTLGQVVARSTLLAAAEELFEHGQLRPAGSASFRAQCGHAQLDPGCLRAIDQQGSQTTGSRRREELRGRYLFALPCAE
jgi:hypothetical protein